MITERNAISGSTAIFSDDKKHRYYLSRTLAFGGEGARVAFIMLNPSTADAMKNDPTIRRCMGFASDWGYGHLSILNLFALRSPYPRDLLISDDPIGAHNNHYIAHTKADAFVCAWGAVGAPMMQERAAQVLDMLKRKLEPLFHLGDLTKEGQPRHPLYLPKDAPRMLYEAERLG